MHTEKNAESTPFALIVMMAAACGFAVANIYYNQSMRPSLAATFRRGTRYVLVDRGTCAFPRIREPVARCEQFFALGRSAILIDLGNRAGLIADQTRIYALSTEARGRLNTVFMRSSFFGGAAGSAIGASAAGHAG